MQRGAVLLRQPRPLAGQPLVQLGGLPGQLAELLRVAPVERGRGAVVHRHHRGVVGRQAVPLGVHGPDLDLGEVLRELPGRAQLADRREARRDQPRDPAGDLDGVAALARRLLAPDLGERLAVGLELGVAELLAQRVHLGEPGRQHLVQPSGAGQHVLERQVAQLHRGVLHRDQVGDRVGEVLADQLAAARVRRVQQRRHEPVADVEVGLPVERVVLVGPRHVPHGSAGEGHRREAGGLGAQAVLGVVPLDEQRQRQADLVDDHARDQAHEPAVEVDVDPLVQPPRGADVAGREVPAAVAVERRHPPEPPRLDDLAEAVQLGLVVEAEHVAADDRRAAGQVAEGDRADDALGLADDVVVHHQGVRRGALAQRLELAAGIAAGAAEVALLDDPQLVAERGLRIGVELGVDDLLGALLHHHDGVEVGREQLVVAELRDQLGAEVGPVHRGDRDVGGAVLEPVLGDLGRPLGRLDHGVVVAGDDVVPVPAAVHERLERQLEDEGALGLAAGARRVDALRAAVGQRAVDDHGGAAAGDLDGEPDVLDDGPAPPVAGRERVEVGAEREPLAGAHPQRRARLDLVGVDRPRRSTWAAGSRRC